MTIIEHKGDLLAVSTGILVHGCNTLGVMGAGIAHVIKTRYPQAFQQYREAYEAEGLQLGQVIFVEVQQEGAPLKVIANAMTQDKLAKAPGEVVVDYPAITQAFEEIGQHARAFGLPVHFPLIGCGLAGGDWAEVAQRIEQALGPEVEKHLWVL